MGSLELEPKFPNATNKESQCYLLIRYSSETQIKVKPDVTLSEKQRD